MRFSVFAPNMNVLKISCLLAIAALAQACAAQDATMAIQGDVYKSTCATAEREALRQQVSQAAAGHQADALAALVITTLCGIDDKANETVRQASVMPLKLTSNSTGSDKATVTTIARGSLHAYAAAAWNASVEPGSNAVSVHFYKNEACIETLAFRNLTHIWRLVAIEEACD